MPKEQAEFSIIYAARYRGINFYQLHTHKIFQLYVIKGKNMEYTDGTSSVTPDPDSQVILVKPGERHCLRPLQKYKTQSWLDEGINFSFDCKFSVSDEKLYSSLMNLPNIISVGNTDFYRRLGNIIINNLLGDNPATAYNAFATILYSLTTAEERDDSDSEKPAFYTQNTDEHNVILGIDDVKKYIDTNYRKNITLEELVKISCINRTALCREFRRVYSSSPIHYMLAKRMDEAKILLAETRMKVDKMSELLGFSSPSYFNRIFKRFSGMTPGEFRCTNQSESLSVLTSNRNN